jgi:2-keto-4-pentenoate hydratase/2-oxohepta-3-ene-1,7-dioic acid hydratase in catechol pathway
MCAREANSVRIIRYLGDRDQVRYGVIENGMLHPCAGDPFTNLVKYSRPVEIASVKVLAPVAPPNIVCSGLNYKTHADETGMPRPSRPLIFLKASSSVCGPGDPIVLPAISPEKIDYEVELAIIIGKRARNISEEDAGKFILGYTIANDVSDREAQFADGQWSRAKSYDSFCPLGPEIVTDLDGDNLDLTCRVDGQVLQAANTSDMIFSCRQLVSYMSRCMTLLPGTVILTGTPSGVGFTRTPPVFLREGQTVECEIAGIGILTNPIAMEK